MVGQVCEEAAEDEVLCCCEQGGADEDEDVLGDKEVYVLSLVDADGACDEATCPDERGPGHHERVVKPFVAEEGLVGDVAPQSEDEEGEGNWGGDVGGVGVEGPVGVGVGGRHDWGCWGRIGDGMGEDICGELDCEMRGMREMRGFPTAFIAYLHSENFRSAPHASESHG